ncbi:MAG: hypothetical protein Q7J84_10560 [Sulfuricaulis sp.]|nr:hypothetical protein [Sulfuricaulis sp.]
MKFSAFLWPDRVIGKRESRRIRDEHNALYNSHAELAGALRDLFEQCATVHKHWGEGDNTRKADAAQERARAALKGAE